MKVFIPSLMFLTVETVLNLDNMNIDKIFNGSTHLIRSKNKVNKQKKKNDSSFNSHTIITDRE